MAYEIEKGVPIPPPLGMGPRGKYPWRTMEVGDSFFVPNKKSGQMAAQAAGKKAIGDFVVRTEGTGIRVWRIA